MHDPQFGMRSDKHIVKMDVGVSKIAGWYLHVPWKYFDEYGNVCEEHGPYLICNNGFLQWPTLICPFMNLEGNSPLESFFSGNVESVRKDVEYCFGIFERKVEVARQRFLV